jgi:hypothetical protein
VSASDTDSRARLSRERAKECSLAALALCPCYLGNSDSSSARGNRRVPLPLPRWYGASRRTLGTAWFGKLATYRLFSCLSAMDHGPSGTVRISPPSSTAFQASRSPASPRPLRRLPLRHLEARHQLAPSVDCLSGISEPGSLPVSPRHRPEDPLTRSSHYLPTPLCSVEKASVDPCITACAH